jgi:hypothetical protein
MQDVHKFVKKKKECKIQDYKNKRSNFHCIYMSKTRYHMGKKCDKETAVQN